MDFWSFPRDEQILFFSLFVAALICTIPDTRVAFFPTTPPQTIFLCQETVLRQKIRIGGQQNVSALFWNLQVPTGESFVLRPVHPDPQPFFANTNVQGEKHNSVLLSVIENDTYIQFPCSYLSVGSNGDRLFYARFYFRCLFPYFLNTRFRRNQTLWFRNTIFFSAQTRLCLFGHHKKPHRSQKMILSEQYIGKTHTTSWTTIHF